MRKKFEWAWEALDANTFRAKAVGGWLVKHTVHDAKKGDVAISMLFIPDNNHEWAILMPVPKVVEEKKEWEK